MLARARYQAELRSALGRSPVAMLVGPRQSGKSTLARELQPDGEVHFFDLEDPAAAAALAQPMTALRSLRGLVVLDEAQRQPELFPVLRVLADRPEGAAKFLVLGSASPELSRQSARVARGARRDRRAAWLRSRRGRHRGARRTLGARWLPPLVPRRQLCRQLPLAAGLPVHVPRARSRRAGFWHGPGRDAALLDDALALPRPDLERRRDRVGDGGVAAHDAQVPSTRCSRPTWSACCSRGTRTSASAS
jgi:hypothetical protein